MRQCDDLKPHYIRWFLAVTVTLAGVVHAGGPGSGNVKTIEGSIWYRERIALPPSAEIRVLLEDVARMDVPAEVIASTRVEPKGGPPWSFSLYMVSSRFARLSDSDDRDRIASVYPYMVSSLFARCRAFDDRDRIALVYATC